MLVQELACLGATEDGRLVKIGRSFLMDRQTRKAENNSPSIERQVKA